VFDKFQISENDLSIKLSDLEPFLRLALKGQANNPEVLAFKKKIMSENQENGTVSMGDLAKVLPTEENFLLQFQKRHHHHIVDFMKIWYNYDTDKNGYLEAKELTGFVGDLVESEEGKKLTESEIEDYCNVMLSLYDKNKDGKIELSELQKIINKEENFLLQFQEDLTEESFEKMFGHYDLDKNGVIEGPELIGLLRDLKEHAADKEDPDYVPPTTKELEEYRDMIMSMSDDDHDGKLQKTEIKMLFLG